MAELSSCCCFSLQMGSTIIALTDIVILGILHIILLVVEYGLWDTREGFADHVHKPGINNYSSTTQYFTHISELEAVFDDPITTSILSVFEIFIGVATIIFGFVLLYGIRKDVAYLMKVWIIFRAIAVSMNIVTGLIGFLTTLSILDFFIDFVKVTTILWFINVVHSYKQSVLARLTTDGVIIPSSTARATLTGVI